MTATNAAGNKTRKVRYRSDILQFYNDVINEMMVVPAIY